MDGRNLIWCDHKKLMPDMHFNEDTCIVNETGGFDVKIIGRKTPPADVERLLRYSK